MKIGDFKIIKKIGVGSFGKVFEVEKDGKIYALKVIEKADVSLRELDIMGRLRHPNLMSSEMIVCDDKKLGILMEKAEKDLFHAIYEKSFSISDRLKVLKSISKGVKFLHNSGYLHLDLKPCNILIFEGNHAKITDFSLSMRIEKNSKYYPSKLTTIDHRPINVLYGSRNYTEKDDVWSLGLIFLRVLSLGKSLFSKFKEKDFKADKVRKRYEEKLSSEVIEDTLNTYLSNLEKPLRNKTVKLLLKMLEFEPKYRASMDDVLNYFDIKEDITDDINEDNYELKPIIPDFECNLKNYEGFDALVKLSMKIPINLETFFLAADMYQRILPIRRHHDDECQDYKYTVYVATLSLYMATKISESYYVKPKKFIESSGNIFTVKDLIDGETALIEEWQGIFYPNNLFTNSSTLGSFKLAFELSRNCFIYRRLDLKQWKKNNDKQEIEEGEYNKYTPFITFLSQTNYYKLMCENDDLENKLECNITQEYIKNLYETDIKF